MYGAQVFGKTGLAARAALCRPAELWLLPARVAQTLVGAPNSFATDIPETGTLSLRDCGKHRFRPALGWL